MFHSIRNRLLGALCGASVALTGASTTAQHSHGGGHYHYQPGHSHYQPGHFHAHGGHYDYHPGRYTYHPGSYTYHPETVYAQPSYAGGGVHDSHPHDHAATQPHYPVQRVEYRFGGFSHVDDLAASLENQANLLCWELHYNYQHNPGYRGTYREVYEMSQVAKFIHGLEHARNRERIKEEVVRMDRLFHHIQRDVAHWTGHHHRHVGRGGLTSKLEELEDTLHHLMDDVGVRSQPAPSSSGGTDLAAPAAPATEPPTSDFELIERP